MYRKAEQSFLSKTFFKAACGVGLCVCTLGAAEQANLHTLETRNTGSVMVLAERGNPLFVVGNDDDESLKKLPQWGDFSWEPEAFLSEYYQAKYSEGASGNEGYMGDHKGSWVYLRLSTYNWKEDWDSRDLGTLFASQRGALMPGLIYGATDIKSSERRNAESALSLAGLVNVAAAKSEDGAPLTKKILYQEYATVDSSSTLRKNDARYNVYREEVAIRFAPMAVTRVVTSAADAGENTLRAAMTGVENEDTIIFNFALNTTITLAQSLPAIDVANLTFDGAGGGGLVTLSGLDFYSIFVASDAQGVLSINNLTVQRGGGNNNSHDYGGAVWAAGRVVLGGSTQFLNNSVNVRGGAILAKGGLEVGTNAVAVFKGNWTSNQSGGGGALAVESDVVVNGSVRFENNTSGASGGAIFSNTGGSVWLNNTAVFQRNGSGAHGGAILSDSLYLQGTADFIENVAGGSGGAVYLRGNLSITNPSTAILFQGNKATEFGGAIYARGSVSLAGTASFIGNELTGTAANGGAGGAIYAEGNVTLNGVATFQANKSVTSGAAIQAHNTVTINGRADFLNNQGTSTLYATRVESSADSVLIFSGNTSIGIYALESVDLKGQSSFKGMAGGSASAIASEGSVTLAKRATFEDNIHLTGSGGGIFAKGNVTISGADTVSSFTGNSGYAGGGIYAESGNVAIAGSTTFSQNSAMARASSVAVQAGRSGGAICVNGELSITGDGSFIGNSAQDNGGAFYAYKGTTYPNSNPQTGKITVNGTAVFRQNTAGGAGGAMSAAADVLLQSSATDKTGFNFESNSANAGGAVSATSGTVTLAGKMQFVENKATGAEGGAIRGKTVVTSAGSDVNFTNNQSLVGTGGAVYANSGVSFQGQALFEGNAAKMQGGAIYSGSNVVLAGDVDFISNSSTTSSGGGIYAVNSVQLKGASDFETNTARAGGAIYTATGGGVIIDAVGKSATFTENQAVAGAGGAIYAGSQGVSINSDAVFSGNSATAEGGAIFIYGSGDCLVGTSSSDISFIGNSAGAQGGAIYNNGTVELAGKVGFEGNTGEDGGAVYVGFDGWGLWGSDINVRFVGNRAAGSGGAVYLDGNNLSLSGVVLFQNNEAGFQGGGIYSSTDIPSDIVLDANLGTVAYTGNVAKGGGSVADAASGGFLYMAGPTDSMKFSVGANTVLQIGRAITDANYVGAHDSIAGGSRTTIEKTGVGTLVLNADNSAFRGTLNVTQGKLVVNGRIGQSASTQKLNVATATVLSGVGTVWGTTIVKTGGIIAPGDSIGVLTLEHLDIAGGAQIQIEYGDKVAVVNSLNLGNASTTNRVQVQFMPGFSFLATDYPSGYEFMTFSSAISVVGSIENYFSLGGLADGYHGELRQLGGNSYSYVVIAIPEPGVYGLFGLALAGVSLVRRRYKRKSK